MTTHDSCHCEGDHHESECPLPRCSYCGEVYALDTAEVIRGRVYCSDCAVGKVREL